PASFSDPFGLLGCPQLGNCTQSQGGQGVYITRYGAAHHASIQRLQQSSRQGLLDVSNNSGHVLGLNATTNGKHDDPRHNGVSNCCPSRSDPSLSGLAADVGEIDHQVVGSSAASQGLSDVESAALGSSDVKE